MPEQLGVRQADHLHPGLVLRSGGLRGLGYGMSGLGFGAKGL